MAISYGHLLAWLAAAPLLRVLWAVCYGLWLFLVPGLVLWVRLAAAPLRRVLRRAHALRDRSGQPSACVFLGLSPKKSQMVAVNLGQRPRTRRQRLPAATEMSKAVLCTSPELAQVKALGLSSSSDSPFTQPVCERRALVIDRTQRTCIKITCASVVTQSDN